MPTRELELLALGCSGAHEHGVELPGVEQRAQALDGGAEPQIGAHVDDVADLLVEHARRQAECRDVGAHQTAGHRELLENGHFVAERQQIVRDGEGGRARADAGDALAVLLVRRSRQECRHVVAMVGGHPLQAANGDRLALDAAAAAGRLAGPVADPAEDPGKHIRFPVHHVGLGELPLGDEADVFGYVGVGWAGPLAIYYSMKIIRFPGVGRFHDSSNEIARANGAIIVPAAWGQGCSGAQSWPRRAVQGRIPPPRSTWPGRAPVGDPSLMTGTPFTSTHCMPTES